MKKNIKIAPERLPAITGFFGGIVFCFLGVFRMIPMFGPMGVLWVILSILVTVISGVTLIFSKGPWFIK